jgi:hypothetical protein
MQAIRVGQGKRVRSGIPKLIDFASLPLYYEYLRFISLIFFFTLCCDQEHSGVFNEKSDFAI